MVDQNYPDKYLHDQVRHDTYIKAFMKCFDALTKGSPDGYCARDADGHWNEGLCETVTKHRYNSIEIFREKRSVDIVQPSQFNLPGWRVVPVKILEVEGS